MATKCSKCGTVYDGWSCPTCALEAQQRKTREAMERAASEQKKVREATEKAAKEQKEQQWAAERQAAESRDKIIAAIEAEQLERESQLQETAEELKRIVAKGPELRANELVEKAVRQYRRELFADTAKLCQEAISLDPENLAAHYWLVHGLIALERPDKAKEYLARTIKLLRYDRNQGELVEGYPQVARAIDALGRPSDMTRAFTELVKATASQVMWQGFGIDRFEEQVKTLVEYGVVDAARFLCESNLKRAKCWEAATVRLCVLYLELGRKTGISVSNELVGQAASAIPFILRDGTLAELDRLQTDTGVSQEVKNIVISLVRGQDARWRSEFKAEKRQEVAQQPRRTPVLRGGLEFMLILAAGILMGFLENYRLIGPEEYRSQAESIERLLMWPTFLAPLLFSALERNPGWGFAFGCAFGIGAAFGLSRVPLKAAYLSPPQAVLQGIALGVACAIVAAIFRWISSKLRKSS